MRIITTMLLLGGLTGCAALWGGSYFVPEKNGKGIVIQYDTALTSSIMMQKIATKHCNNYNKKIEIIDSRMPGIMLGIIEEKYACIDK